MFGTSNRVNTHSSEYYQQASQRERIKNFITIGYESEVRDVLKTHGAISMNDNLQALILTQYRGVKGKESKVTFNTDGWVQFAYRMATDRSYDPGKRPGTEIVYSFALPPDIALNLMKAINRDPLFLDVYFQQMYPEVAKGLKRPDTDRLFILDQRQNPKNKTGDFISLSK